MKKKILLSAALAIAAIANSQTTQQWTTDLLNLEGESETILGTGSETSLNFYTNGQKRVEIGTDGKLKFFNLATGSGIGSINYFPIFANSEGEIVSLNDEIIQAPQNETSIWSKPCLPNAMTWFEGGNKIGPAGSNLIGTCNNYDFILKANDNYAMWIKPSSKVGIGEANPTAKFEVYESTALGTTAGNNKLLTSIRGNAANNNFMHNEWLVRDGSANTDWKGTILHDGISVDASFLNPEDGAGNTTRTWWSRQPYADVQKWGNGTNTYMKLEKGNLYIGTKKVQTNQTHANALVQIYGKVVCTEFVILDQTKWADYVFDKNYHLRSLKEVEHFYKSNKHLPDVPSEKEVLENGINVAEMNVTLLRKIEELTLYVVDLNNKVETLQKENEKLKKNK